MISPRRTVLALALIAGLGTVSDPAYASSLRGFSAGKVEDCIDANSAAACQEVLLAPCDRWQHADTQDLWARCLETLANRWRRVARRRLEGAVSDRPISEADALRAMFTAFDRRRRSACREEPKLDTPHLRKVPRYTCRIAANLALAQMMRDPAALLERLNLPEEEGI
ncbi:MAG: hypothetical protein AAF577_05665 [Pseudomonadota bacterium]